MRVAHTFVVSPKDTRAEAQPSLVPAPPDSGRGIRVLFSRVPTHAVGVAAERRHSARAFLRLPVRLTQVEGTCEGHPVSLVTRDISSSGIYFLAPRRIEPGTAIEIEVALVERPLGQGTVKMSTAAHIIRTDATEIPGWHGLAAQFDNFEFQRDEAVPPHFGR